jgi:hypothetical protein
LDEQRNVYELEYQVNRQNQQPQSGGVPVVESSSLRCISVIGFIASANTLVTQTLVAPASQWSSSSDASNKLRKVATSFRLNMPNS